MTEASYQKKGQLYSYTPWVGNPFRHGPHLYCGAAGHTPVSMGVRVGEDDGGKRYRELREPRVVDASTSCRPACACGDKRDTSVVKYERGATKYGRTESGEGRKHGGRGGEEGDREVNIKVILFFHFFPPLAYFSYLLVMVHHDHGGEQLIVEDSMEHTQEFHVHQMVPRRR